MGKSMWLVAFEVCYTRVMRCNGLAWTNKAIDFLRYMLHILPIEKYPSEISLSHKFCGKVQDSYTLRCIPQVSFSVPFTCSFTRPLTNLHTYFDRFMGLYTIPSSLSMIFWSPNPTVQQTILWSFPMMCVRVDWVCGYCRLGVRIGCVGVLREFIRMFLGRTKNMKPKMSTNMITYHNHSLLQLPLENRKVFMILPKYSRWR